MSTTPSSCTSVAARTPQSRNASPVSTAATDDTKALRVFTASPEACGRDVFTKLWSLTVGRRVEKERYAVPEGHRVWEIDSFVDRELFLAEIELESEAEQVSFPAWLAPYVVRDVTDEPTYVNAKLAR